MVYLTYPPSYTEEEEMLIKKYQKLKRKKRILGELKAPKQEAPIVALKRSQEAKIDAKETAKKLLKSGAIKAIKVENKEKKGFKRPKGMERKRGFDRMGGGSLTGYQPFTPSHSMEEDDSFSDLGSMSPKSTPPHTPKSTTKNLYESFASPREVEPRKDDGERDGKAPRTGNTVYVFGYGIKEDVLRTGLTPYGNIINISMEMDKHVGFVTFDKVESAEKAITELNGKKVSDIKLRVSYARHQLLVPNSENTAWSTIAASNLPTSSIKDNRGVVAYDDVFC